MALIVVLQNVSGLAPVSDYKFKVMVGDGTVEKSHVITEGVVRGHTRADGWRQLVSQLLQETEG